MVATTKTEVRARTTGRFTYSSKFERLCTCGRTLGVHDAEAPHAFGDYALDGRDLPDCEGFKPTKKGKQR